MMAGDRVLVRASRLKGTVLVVIATAAPYAMVRLDKSGCIMPFFIRELDEESSVCTDTE